jgi:mutator protein MutT
MADDQGAPADPDVIFHTRKGCSLCDKLWPHVVAKCRVLGLRLASVDVDSSDDVRARHGDWVPVISIGGRVRLRGIVSPDWLERELTAYASRSTPADSGENLQDIRVGVAIVGNQDGRILVNRRPEGTYFGGWWEWPGGKCGMGERPRDCAARELKEEIGISATDWRLFDLRTVMYPGRRVKLWFFRAALDPMTRPHERALEHRWLFPAEIQGLKFLEPNLPVLDMLMDRRGSTPVAT